METQGNPPPFNLNPWDPPLHPPPPPPPNFQWQAPGFSGDVFHQFHPFNAPPDQSFATGAGGGFGNPRPHFQRKRKFDRNDDGNFAKLYVGVVPRTVTQEEIRLLFEEHGNVIEVVLLHDKWTGQRQEYCFVKYASVEEADRAITALHNQFTFPGAMAPIKVKYADGERRRLGLDRVVQHDSSLSRSGLVQHDSTFSAPVVREAEFKVYVNGLNKEASRQEIEEIFSSFGVVADVYIMRDESKRSRGCGFVGFSHRYMAVAAINGLNGSYVMKGCDRPLVVRFADPKKPKNGELRPAPHHVDMRGSNQSNALHMGSSSTSTPGNTTGIQAGVFPPVENRLQCPASSAMQQPLHQQSISPSRFSQMSLEEPLTLLGSSQSSGQTDSQSQTALHLNQASIGSIEQQHDHQSPQPCRDTGSSSVILTSEPASCALSGSDLSEAPMDCDWSEHICPDGHKYYFNCLTFESRWEKPEEFVLYEKHLRRQQLKNRAFQEPHPFSTSEASSSEEDCQTLAAQNQNESCDSVKPQLPVPCAMEHSHEQVVQVETSLLGGPAFVQ